MADIARAKPRNTAAIAVAPLSKPMRSLFIRGYIKV